MPELLRNLLMTIGARLLNLADSIEATAYDCWPGHPEAAEDGIVIVSPLHEWAAHHLWRYAMRIWELGWHGSQEEADAIAEAEYYDHLDSKPYGYFQLTTT